MAVVGVGQDVVFLSAIGPVPIAMLAVALLIIALAGVSLRASRRELEDQATTDGLTRLGNHRKLLFDLERRIHRNQPLPNLSQMAYVILQGAIRKLEERHRLELLTEVGRGMKLINTGKDNFNLEVREIGDEIRPPMVTIPAYAERRRSLKDR